MDKIEKELWEKHMPITQAVNLKDDLYNNITEIIGKALIKERESLYKSVIKGKKYQDSREEKKNLELQQKIYDHLTQLTLETNLFKEENDLA